MLFALAALPAVDVLSKRTVRVMTLVGAMALSVIFLCWGVLLQANLEPWIAAGNLMSGLHSQVVKIADETPEGSRVLLLDIPRDYSGAGLLTRPQYLSFMAQQPVSDKDYSNKLITIEPVISGSHDFIWPAQFGALLKNRTITKAMIWNQSNGAFVPWTQNSNGTSDYTFDFAANGVKGLALDPANTILADAKSWHLMSTVVPCIERTADSAKVYPSASGLIMWLPVKGLDPTKASVVIADLSKEDAVGCSACLGGKVSLAWQVAGDSKIHEAPIMHGQRGHYVLWIGRYRAWTLAGDIVKVGLSFKPGDYHVDLKSLTIGSDTTAVPKLSLVGITDVVSAWMHSVKAGEKLQLSYDVSEIPNAKLIKLYATKSGVTAEANGEAEIDAYMPLSAQSTPMNDWEIKGDKGVIDLPQEVLNSKGVHQVRIIALDANGSMIGFPSEPITINVAE